MPGLIWLPEAVWRQRVAEILGTRTASAFTSRVTRRQARTSRRGDRPHLPHKSPDHTQGQHGDPDGRDVPSRQGISEVGSISDFIRRSRTLVGPGTSCRWLREKKREKNWAPVEARPARASEPQQSAFACPKSRFPERRGAEAQTDASSKPEWGARVREFPGGTAREAETGSWPSDFAGGEVFTTVLPSDDRACSRGTGGRRDHESPVTKLGRSLAHGHSTSW